MSKLFCLSPGFRVLERQMQEPPGYRPRGYGICIIEEMDWKSRGNYSEIVDCVISRMQLEHLKKRVEEIFAEVDKELIFRSMKHRNDFYSLLMGKRFGTCKCGNIYSEKLPHPSEEGEPDEHGKVRYKCIPVLCGNWKQVTGNLLIAEGENFVEALRSGAFLTCIYEGKITVIGIPEKETEEREKIQISSWLIAYEGEPTRTGGVEIDIRTEEREKLKENNIKRDGISNVDWYSYEEYTTEDGKLTINKYAVEQYKNIGGKVSEQPDVNGAFVNEKRRYWVAVGPEILSPGYNEQPVEEQTISDNQFKYGTEIDVVLQNSKDKSEVYIECIIGDVKAHTYPNGVFQTGDAYPNCLSKDDGSKHRNGSYIEFINEPKFEDNYINGNMSDYVVIDIIVYERGM